MSDSQIKATDYIGTSRKDWSTFLNQISDNTGIAYHALWLENAKRNKQLFKECGWACEELQDAHEGKTAVLLGASPAIRKQVETLQSLQHDPDFVFFGISSGLSFLFKHDIKPKYAIIADADPDMKRFWKDVDMEKTKDITLISSVCVHPDLLKMWKGPIKFIAIYTSEKKVNRLIEKKYRPINGVGAWFHAISSQYNTAAAFSFLVLRTHILIFVGCEMGFADKETPYYADREDVKDKWVRKPHIDIYGNVAYSNMSLMGLKLALEDFLGKMYGAGWFFNCTEAGIFGVSIEYMRKTGTANLPWIYPVSLKNGIAQARHIMRYGEPLTFSKPQSKIVVPKMIQEVSSNVRF